MKFGKLKSKIENKLIESYKNDTIKNDMSKFNSLVLKNKNVSKLFYLYDELTLRHSEAETDRMINSKDLNFERWFDSYCTRVFDSDLKIDLKTSSLYKEIWISNDLRAAEGNLYLKNYQEKAYSEALLKKIDNCWTEHIERMSFIRETINWRSYGQQNPLIEYNLQAYDSFSLLLVQIRSSMLYYFLIHKIY
jgi:preprotein translocase subunit SecA